MKSTVLKMFAVAILFNFIAVSSKANAADIYAYNNEFLHCRIKLSGPIVKGDAEKLRKFIKSIYGKPEFISLEFANVKALNFGEKANWDNVKDYDQFKKHRICLDSNGGSFVEALKITDMFMPGLGTVVERGANCLSACSIIFMAGAYREGDNGVFPDRFLHAGGNLGFHSPSLVVAEGTFDAKSVMKAYKIAIKSIAGIQSRLAKLKIGRGLLLAQLSTPSDDMYMIETTGQAAQWEIPIFGTVHPQTVDLFHAEQACANLMSNIEQFSHPKTFGDTEPIERVADVSEPIDLPVLRNWQGTKFEELESASKGKLTGYGQEAAGICDFQYDKNSKLPDMLLGLSAGQASFKLGHRSGSLSLHPFHLFGPSTPLKSIVRQRDDVMELALIPTTDVTDRSSNKQRCMVISRNKILDNKPCDYSSITRLQSKGILKNVSQYKWPSGAITVVETRYGNGDNISKINGAKAVVLKSIAFPNNLKLKWESRNCLLNQKSGNVFCSKFDSQ